MTARELFPAAIAFVLGAAFVAGGEPDEKLHDTLAKLRKEAARLQALNRPDEDEEPPVDTKGRRYAAIGLEHVTLPVSQFPAPWRTPPHRLRNEDTEDEDPWCRIPDPQPFGTVEEILELVRCVIEPKTWELRGGPTTFARDLLLHHSPDLADRVRRFVEEELRPAATSTVAIDAELVEVSAEAAPALAAAAGRALTDAEHERLAAAARRFSGRILALSGQTVVLRHGRQAALVIDAEHEIAERRTVVDPHVDVALLGIVLRTSAAVRDKSTTVRVKYTLEDDRLEEPVPIRNAGRAGSIQVPAYDRTRLEGSIAVPLGRWAVAGEASKRTAQEHPHRGTRRFLLMRVRAPGRKAGR